MHSIVKTSAAHYCRVDNIIIINYTPVCLAASGTSTGLSCIGNCLLGEKPARCVFMSRSWCLLCVVFATVLISHQINPAEKTPPRG